MYIQNNLRKYSIDESSDTQEHHLNTLLFPQNDNFNHEETLHMLKLKYKSSIHQINLINHCYRCHKTSLIKFYHQFIQNEKIVILEPKISNYYQNQSFISLYQLGRYLQGCLQTYPSIHINSIPKTFKFTIDQIFYQYGYIPNFQRFLLFYPEYLQKHRALQKILFDQHHIDGKIAYFLAILACAELGSVYGMNRMLKKFRKIGGNIQWVTSKKYPEKIKKIFKLNKILARAIWKIDSDLIQEIIQTNLWSEKQLAFVIQILTFSHYFATITLAIGLNPQQLDNDLVDFQTLMKIKDQYDSQFYESAQGQRLAIVIENINKANSDQQTQKNQKNQKKQRKQQLLGILKNEKKVIGNKKFLKKQLRKSDNQQNIVNYMKQIGNQLTTQQLYSKMHQCLKFLLPKYQILQKRHDKDYPPRDQSDQNFKITAFPILYNLTNDAAQKALDLITYSQIMTSNNFGTSIIDNTKPFRKAIRYYSQNLCGFFHFQYDYTHIPPLLPMPFKFYIRLLTLSPLHIKKQVLTQIRHVEEGKFNLFDLGHVALITANCKMGLAMACAVHEFQC